MSPASQASASPSVFFLELCEFGFQLPLLAGTIVGGEKSFASDGNLF
jgi:hypothetical protein